MARGHGPSDPASARVRRLDPEEKEQVVAIAAAAPEEPENGNVRFYRWCASCRRGSTGNGDVEDQDNQPIFIV